MICNIIILAFIISLIGLMYMFYKYVYSKPNALFQFQNFEKVDEIPYIIIDIQGQKLKMMVDSGCGISIIDSGVANKLEHEKSPRKINFSALTSDSITSEVVSIPVTVGSKKIIEDFALYDDGNIGNFESLHGITLHGILGAEFFEKTNCMIDYKKHCLIIP